MRNLGLVVSFLFEVTKRVIDLLKAVLPVAWMVLSIVLKAMIFTALIIWSALRPEIDNMANAIEYNLAEHVPLNLHDYLHRFAVFLASLSMILSWVCLSFVSMWTVNAILKVLWR